MGSEQEALRRIQGQSDSSTPNFFSVNSKGEVTAEFEGLIKALGIIFPEATEQELRNSIEWVDNEEVLRSFIFGFLNELGHGLSINASGGPKMVRLLLESYAATQQAEVGVGAVFRTLLNHLGASSFVQLSEPAVTKVTLREALTVILSATETSQFLQLPAVAKKQFANGQTALAIFPAGSKKTNVVTISHGLSTTPQSITLSIVTAEGENTYGYRIIERTATTFKFMFNAATAVPEEIKPTILWQAAS